MRPREPQGQLIRFGSRCCEEAHLERSRHRRGQLCGELQRQFVEIPRIRVQSCQLGGDSLRHRWMRVTDVRHVVVGVDKRPAGLVEQVLHPATNDLKGLLTVRQADVGAEEPPASPEQFFS